MTAKEHNRLVGIFLMAHGGIQALVMIFIAIIYGVMGAAFAIGGRAEEKFIGVIFIAMIAVLSIFVIFFSGSQILGGYKLFKEKGNARTWGIIGSVVSCLFFPIGTAVGVYGLWFLFGDQGKQFYLGGPSRPAIEANSYQPPQPGAWQ